MAKRNEISTTLRNLLGTGGTVDKATVINLARQYGELDIPNTVTSLAEATTVGAAGVSTDGPDLRYYPPCSSGPGEKTYTFTLYALSGVPTFTAPVTGKVLTDTISPLIIGSSQVNVTYTRTGL